MSIQKVIERLGYSHNEAKVYLISLRYGASTISELATKTEIPRTSLIGILEKLHKNGLMNFFIQHKHRYWTAEKPEKLLLRLQENETELKNILPKLKTLRHNNLNEPIINIFNGSGEIDLIHEDILTTKHRLYGIITWNKWLSMEGNRIDDFTEKRIQHFLPSQLLVPKNQQSIKIKERISKGLQHIRFLPPSFPLESTILIYGSKVAFISFSKKSPTAILVDASDIRDTMFAFFESLWNHSSE